MPQELEHVGYFPQSIQSIRNATYGTWTPTSCLLTRDNEDLSGEDETSVKKMRAKIVRAMNFFIVSSSFFFK